MSLTTQFYTMIAMISMGCSFGAAFDTYSRFFNRKTQKKWFVFICDIFFWITQALLTFYVLYQVNNGEIRFYIFLALLCGYAAYQGLFKKIYEMFLEKIIQLGLFIYRKLLQISNILVVKPLRFLITLFITVFLAMIKFLWTVILFIWKIIYGILKFVFKPFVIFSKFIWCKLPKSFRIGLSNGIQFFSKGRNWIVKLFKRNPKQ